MNINLLFEQISNEQTHIDEFNRKLFSLDERKRKMCTIYPTDSGNKIRKKCKVARVWGVHHAPVWDRYMQTHDTSADSGDGAGEGGGEGGVGEGRGFVFPTSPGPEQDNRIINDEKSSTERVRRYYRRHPEKVRKYLKKTQDDRVARNRDRRKAVQKHGKSKMKNHDVHHPKGPKGGSWRLAKKDHGRDKKNENIEYVYLSELMEGHFPKGKWRLIAEGGAAGHMAHPYEDGELTFADIKEMVNRGLVGGLDTEGPVTEKLDGQNITFTVRDGRIVFARNKGQIKNRGQNAVDVSGIRTMFAGHANPNVERAFVNSAEDLEAAIAALPPEQREEMFGDGRRFMNVEVIFPDTKNVIPYDKPVLVFHGTIEYNDEGEEVGRNVEAGRTLDRQLQAVNAQNQQTFGISGPQTITFNDADTIRNKQRMQEYAADIARMQAEFGLDDNATIDDYKRAWWSREIDNSGIDWTPEEREGLLSRWASGDKSFGVKNIKDAEKKAWFREFEATRLKDMQRRGARPLERLFLRLGADVLLRVTNTLSANNPDAAAKLRQEVLGVIKKVRESGTDEQMQILQRELERLEDIGIDNIVPTEGVVFIYKGKPYKFTGTFAPVNQILGIMKFQRGGAGDSADSAQTEPPAQEKPPTPAEPTPPAPAEPTAEPSADKPVAPTQSSERPRPIAIFPGRFQPFHAGHYSVYQSLVQQFGKENVYIATSDKTDPAESPFGFNEKRQIMTQMFGIPEEMIVQTKQPMRPIEITGNLPENVPVVMSFSEKDKDRLSGKYFKPYDPDAEMAGYKEHGYIIVAPEMQLQLQDKNISGTQIRALMGNPQLTDDAKKEIFTMIYGKFDPEIFKKIVRTTTDSEEALRLTQMHGADAPKKSRAKKSQTPAPDAAAAPATQAAPVAQDTPPPTQAQPAPQAAAPKPAMSSEPFDSSQYQAGEVWRMPKGNYGAKNQKGRIQYFGTEERARLYAQQSKATVK